MGKVPIPITNVTEYIEGDRYNVINGIPVTVNLRILPCFVTVSSMNNDQNVLLWSVAMYHTHQCINMDNMEM